MSTGLVTYEERLSRDRLWGLREGSMHFEKDSLVFQTLRSITKRLDELGVPYAVVGGMAMFLHGYQRFTQDVDILVNAEGLKTIHDRLEGLGYLPPFANSKHLRDTQTGVRIEFLVSGQYPGDGKPKDVAFPEPTEAAEEIEGIKCLTLRHLIELKLLSGSQPGRRKDLGDVQELIRMQGLPRDFSNQLHPMVQPLFLELWNELQIEPNLG